MADTKISALPASTVPLAGTEVLPIVQSSTTKQVSVADLTAGRAISATQLTLTTGNVIVASGQGIDFSATSHPAGMTSELLADYEEGTWTPTLTSAGGNFTTIAYGDQQGTYTKVGRTVTVGGNLFTSGAITAGSASGQLYIAGLPYACALANLGQIWTSPDTANYNSPLALATGVFVSASTLKLFKNGTVNNSNFNVTDLYTVGGPSNNFFFQATYFV